MDSHIPAGLVPRPHPLEREHKARRLRMRLQDGGRLIDVDEMWKDGFALSRKGPQPERGFVDLFDGARHLYRALIYKVGARGDQQIYGYKISRKAGLSQPSDYERDTSAPIAFLPGATS